MIMVVNSTLGDSNEESKREIPRSIKDRREERNRLRSSLSQDDLAALAFARDNEEGLASLTLEQAKLFFRILMLERMPVAQLLARVAALVSPQVLLPSFIRYCISAEDLWHDLLDALAEKDQRWWEYSNLDLDVLIDLISDQNPLAYLLEKHETPMLRTDHPLNTKRPSDVYWRKKITPMINGADIANFWNAFVEIYNASIGFIDSLCRRGNFSNQEDYSRACQLPENRCYAASPEAITTFVLDLYRAMVQRGRLSELTEESRSYPSVPQMSVKLISCGHPPYDKEIDHPGLKIARKMNAVTSGSDGSYVISFSGLCAFAIAEHLYRAKELMRRTR